jgi:hypothetical protein
MESLFWVSTAVVLYVYAGYPLLLAVTSIIVAAHGEASPLPARVANLPARTGGRSGIRPARRRSRADVTGGWAPDCKRGQVASNHFPGLGLAPRLLPVSPPLRPPRVAVNRILVQQPSSAAARRKAGLRA